MPPSVAAAVPGTVALSPRTRLLLEGPVPTTLLRLAAPNVLVMMQQATVSTMDAVFGSARTRSPASRSSSHSSC